MAGDYQVLSRESIIPLYYQIKEQLRDEFRDADANTRVPSENELAAKYGVSRGTIKQAVAGLVDDGLLYRIKGKGTFVAPPQIPRFFNELPSFTDDISSHGCNPGVTSMEVERVEPPEPARVALRLPHRALTWRVFRVRTANGEPVVISTSYLPCSLVPELNSSELRERSLYAIMGQRYGVRPKWAHDSYRAADADKTIANLLQVPVGKAVLYSERVSYLSDGCPIEYAVGYIRGDRFVIHVDVNGCRGDAMAGQGRVYCPES